MPIKNTLEGKIQYRIKRSKASVFILSDFFDLSDRDQVGRVLRKLVNKGLLIKIAQGAYARTKISSITQKPIPEKDLQALAVELLEKQGVKVVDSTFNKEYNQGNSTQVPAGRVIGVYGRVTKKIGYNGRFIKYQRITRSRNNK